MKIGLLGHGVVGSGVDKIIAEAQTKALQKMHITKILVKDSSEFAAGDGRFTTNANEVLEDPEIDVICECMGGVEPAFTYAKTALEHGKFVVTSNKKMFATCLKELLKTAEKHGAGLAFEATTGGGIPWIAGLERINRVDRVTSFRGIFNGTTNYILSRMTSEKKDLEELLYEAKRLGYAEQDPTDDIDGLDVRYKTVISCVKSFGVCPDIESVPVFGICNISKEDIACAASLGKIVKLIGRGKYENGILSASVMPMLLDATDVLSQVPSNFNMIESDSPALGRAGFMGQGAGSLPTAHAILQDLADYQEKREAGMAKIKMPLITQTKVVWNKADNQREEGVYYIRTKKEDCFREYAKERLENGAILTKKTALTKILDCVLAAKDDTLFLAEVSSND